MAKDAKKTTAFGTSPDSFSESRRRGGEDIYTHTDTDTDAHTYKVTETKSKRLYLLAKPSVHAKLDTYAKEHGDTFNNLIHTLMEEFIEKKGL